MQNERKKLEKSLKPFPIFAIAMGSIIGFGCFVLPGNLFLPTAGPLGTAVGMTVGALITILIASNYGYMVRKLPVAGGAFAYTYKCFGRVHAFICGWFLVLTYLSIVSLNATTLGLIGRYMIPGIFQKGYLYSIAGWEVYAGEIAIACIALIFFAYANNRGVEIAGFMQIIMVVALLGSVIVLTAAAFISPQAPFRNLLPGFPTGSVPLTGILAIVAIAPWAYIGFDCIPQAAEEFDFSPQKTFKLMALAIGSGAFCYVAVSMVTAMVFPWEEFIAGNPIWATGQATEELLGKTGMIFLGLALTAAIVSGINGFYVASSRLLFAMSRARALPTWFEKIHPRYHTPSNALLFSMAVSLATPWFGREVILWVVDMASTGGAIAYLYTCLGVFILARSIKDVSANRTKVLGLGGAMLSVCFLLLLLLPGMPSSLSRQSWIALIVWSVMGVAFYALMRKKYQSTGKKDLDRLIFGNVDHRLPSEK
ncbi:MAG: APC family permease [Firmicutes bacterium]|nr:APC family permease [Bacillota bacterium]